MLRDFDACRTTCLSKLSTHLDTREFCGGYAYSSACDRLQQLACPAEMMRYLVPATDVHRKLDLVKIPELPNNDGAPGKLPGAKRLHLEEDLRIAATVFQNNLRGEVFVEPAEKRQIVGG